MEQLKESYKEHMKDYFNARQVTAYDFFSETLRSDSIFQQVFKEYNWYRLNHFAYVFLKFIIIL